MCIRIKRIGASDELFAVAVAIAVGVGVGGIGAEGVFLREGEMLTPEFTA